MSEQQQREDSPGRRGEGSSDKANEILMKLELEQLVIIVERIMVTNSKEISQLLSVKERDKFHRALKVSEEDLRIFIARLYTLLVQTCYMKAFGPLETFLESNRVPKEKIFGLRSVWSDNFPEFMNQLKQTPTGISRSLKDVKWKIVVPELTSELPTRPLLDFGEERATGDPNRLGDLNNKLYSPDVKNPQVVLSLTTQSTAEKDQLETLSLRLQKMEVQNLFDMLEQIQDRVDKIMA